MRQGIFDEESGKAQGMKTWNATTDWHEFKNPSGRDYIREKKGITQSTTWFSAPIMWAIYPNPSITIEYSPFNKRYHKAVDGTVNDEVLENLDKIKVYPTQVNSE